MKYTIMVLCLVLGTLASQAQIVDRTKDRAEKKANNRADQRIDQGIDKGLDAIEGLFKKKDKSKDKTAKKSSENSGGSGEVSKSGEVADFPGLFGGKADVKDQYAFQHEVKMQVESTDKKGKDSYVQDISIYLSDESPEVGIKTVSEGVKALMVMDTENLVVITLMDQEGQKIGVTAKLNGDMLEVEADPEETPDFRKTGNTKEILGYTCEEYLSEDEDYSYQIWVTNDVDLDVQQAFGGMAGMKKSPTMVAPETPNGMMMEMKGISKKHEEEQVHLLVTEINKNSPHAISTEDYMFLGN